jgi:hypothetical protein
MQRHKDTKTQRCKDAKTHHFLFYSIKYTHKYLKPFHYANQIYRYYTFMLQRRLFLYDPIIGDGRMGRNWRIRIGNGRVGGDGKGKMRRKRGIGVKHWMRVDVGIDGRMVGICVSTLRWIIRGVWC